MRARPPPRTCTYAVLVHQVDDDGNLAGVSALFDEDNTAHLDVLVEHLGTRTRTGCQQGCVQRVRGIRERERACVHADAVRADDGCNAVAQLTI